MEPGLEIYQGDRKAEYAPSELRWRDVTTFLDRYKWVILVVFALTVLGTYATLMFLTEKYETSAAIIVKIGRENVDPPPTASNTNVFSGIRREEVLSEMEFMRSPDLIHEAVREIGIDAFMPHYVAPSSFFARLRFYAKSGVRWVKNQYGETLIALNLEKRLTDEEKAVEEVSQSLDVQYQKDSDVIDLKIRMADRNLSESVLSRVIRLYMVRRIQVKQTTGAEEFLATQATESRSRLSAADAEKEKWKETYKLSSVADQKSLLLRQIREISAEHNATLRDKNAVTEQLKLSKKLLTEAPEQVRSSVQETPNSSTESLRQRLTALTAERAHLLAKFEPTSPQVQDTDGEIARINDLLRNAASTQTSSVTFQANPLRLDLERKAQESSIALGGLEAKAELEEKQLAPLQEELRSIDSAASRLDVIERERQIAENQYLAVVKRKEQADLNTELNRNQISNVSILTPPTSGVEPIYPRSLFLMGIALLVGLVLGVGLSLLLNYMDDRVYDPEHAEMILQVPCLGLIEPAGAFATTPRMRE